MAVLVVAWTSEASEECEALMVLALVGSVTFQTVYLAEKLAAVVQVSFLLHGSALASLSRIESHY